MCRYGLTAEAAFDVLVSLSQDTNRKVYVIACELVEAHDVEAAAAQADERAARQHVASPAVAQEATGS